MHGCSVGGGVLGVRPIWSPRVLATVAVLTSVLTLAALVSPAAAAPKNADGVRDADKGLYTKVFSKTLTVALLTGTLENPGIVGCGSGRSTLCAAAISGGNSFTWNSNSYDIVSVERRGSGLTSVSMPRTTPPPKPYMNRGCSWT